MNLQEDLIEKFQSWQPSAPSVVERTKCSITLDWRQEEPFAFIEGDFIYRLERNEKIPPWVVAYSGGKTSKIIDYLAPRHPYKFRLKVILKATAVPLLAKKALDHYGDEKSVYEAIIDLTRNKISDNVKCDDKKICSLEEQEVKDASSHKEGKQWLESAWSESTWTSTDTDGTSAVCFCMAVRCGYHKQIQIMLEEKPSLIGTVNSTNGFTPLATAVRKGIKEHTYKSSKKIKQVLSKSVFLSAKSCFVNHFALNTGDINTVKLLLSSGAEVEQPSATGQTALHLAILGNRIPITDLLLDNGADLQTRDLNGLRGEHYAVDSGSLEMLKLVLGRGGDVNAKDNHGWTPLFRALCQGAKTEMVEELVQQGSDVELHDLAGLPLNSVARLLKNRNGRNRGSILRLVDAQYPHEKALANFTRLTKKVYNVHIILK